MSGIPYYQMPSAPVQTRWFTYENRDGSKGGGGRAKFGRKGSPAVIMAPGQRYEMLNVRGSGTVRRIWMTTGDHRTAKALRAFKIEMYWDDADTPAVRAPLGDFFCHSLGHFCTFENACFSSPEGRSYNCFVPMPFRKSARIVITNETDTRMVAFYDIAVTLDEPHDDNMLYFHAYWRRENPTTLRKDMTILPRVEGRGRFLGCNHGIRLTPSMANFWWGEGEVKAYIDGDKDYPTLCGTGTEDYIGSAFGQGLFDNLYQGNHFVHEEKCDHGKHPFAKAYGFYRFHIPDPVYFYKDIKVTIQVMGGPAYFQMLESLKQDPTLKFMKKGDGTQYYTREELEANPKKADAMERYDDHCSTAYWYMDRPENGLPPLPPAKERLKDIP